MAFFTIATLKTPLNTAVQQLTSTLAQHEVVAAALKPRSVAKPFLPRMAGAGIDGDLLGRIATAHRARRSLATY